MTLSGLQCEVCVVKF